jgi:hypothetical protein
MEPTLLGIVVEGVPCVAVIRVAPLSSLYRDVIYALQPIRGRALSKGEHIASPIG